MFDCSVRLLQGVAGAAAATVASQYFALAIYAAFLVKNVRSGTMHLPALKRLVLKSKAKQESAAIEQTSAQAPKALPLLKMVLFANAAMLLRTVSLMVSLMHLTHTSSYHMLM
jgi:hypothetical protein